MEILTLNITAGKLPAKVRGLVEEWTKLHEADLLQMWNYQEFHKIDPLVKSGGNIVNCVYLNKAKYLGGFKFYLQFNDGLQGEVDIKSIIDKYDVAKSLKDEKEIEKFYLDF